MERILAVNAPAWQALEKLARALLFSVEAITKTVTQEKAYWLLPNSVKNIDHKECKGIEFTSANTLKRKLDKSIFSGSDTSNGSTLAPKVVKKTTLPA